MLNILRQTSFALAIATFTCASPAADGQRSVENGLLPLMATRSHLGERTAIEDRMRAYGVAGLSVAVIDQGRIAWARGYGVADSSRTPVSANTLFQAASLSKPIAALAALQLVDTSKLALDADINGSLTSWKVPVNEFTAHEKVTLRRLLTHTAGLSDIGIPGVPMGRAVPTLLQFLRGEPPAKTPAITVERAPGGEPVYSGSGYAVLQQVLEDAEHQPFDALISKSVFGRLAMNRSTFQGDPSKRFGRDVALGHYAGGAPVAGGYRQYAVPAAAGLWTTPTDLARYVIAIQDAYAGRPAAIVSAQLTEQVLKAEAGRSEFGLLMSGSGTSVRFGHDGGNEGFEARMVGYLGSGRGAVVMTNSSFSFPLILEVLESIAREYHWPDYPASAQQVVAEVPKVLTEASVGRYAPSEGAPVAVFSKSGRLFVRFPEGVAQVMAAPDGRLFSIQLMYSEYGSPWLVLRPGSGGEPEMLLGDSGEYVLKKARD